MGRDGWKTSRLPDLAEAVDLGRSVEIAADAALIDLVEKGGGQL
jgi:hypothetical protein